MSAQAALSLNVMSVDLTSNRRSSNIDAPSAMLDLRFSLMSSRASSPPTIKSATHVLIVPSMTALTLIISNAQTAQNIALQSAQKATDLIVLSTSAQVFLTALSTKDLSMDVLTAPILSALISLSISAPIALSMSVLSTTQSAQTSLTALSIRDPSHTASTDLRSSAQMFPCVPSFPRRVALTPKRSMRTDSSLTCKPEPSLGMISSRSPLIPMIPSLAMTRTSGLLPLSPKDVALAKSFSTITRPSPLL